jgi:hypothetical protein
MTYFSSPGWWYHDQTPDPPSPSQLPGEDFFTWKNRMHKNPPTVFAGEQYLNDGITTPVVEVTEDTVRWRSSVDPEMTNESYRITFEEWAVSPETSKVSP